MESCIVSPKLVCSVTLRRSPIQYEDNRLVLQRAQFMVYLLRISFSRFFFKDSSFFFALKNPSFLGGDASSSAKVPGVPLPWMQAFWDEPHGISTIERNLDNSGKEQTDLNRW